MAFHQAKYVRCPECGVAYTENPDSAHMCNRDQWVAHQMAEARIGIQRFDTDLTAWLATSAGRFSSWYAERTRP